MTFKAKFHFKFKIYPILSLWVCSRDKSPLIEVRISKFGPKMHLNTVKVPNGFGIYWPRSSVLFLISNQLLFPNFASLIHLRCFVYIFSEAIASECSTSHMAPHIYWFPKMRTGSRETIYLDILVMRPLEFSQPRLGNWHWILQAAIGFRHIIYASYIEIL